MSGDQNAAALERLHANADDLGQLWARLAGDTGIPTGKLDVFYMHGLSKGMVESCDLFYAVANFPRTPSAAFNGSNGQGPSPGSKPGESWPGQAWYREEFLLRGIRESQMCPTRPGLHTRDETDAFVELAKERGWKTAYVVTVPYHWPRSLSCLVASMVKYDYQMKVWFMEPGMTPAWDHPMLGSQSSANTTYGAEARADVARLFSYWDKGRLDEGEAWKVSYGAPPEEIHRYLDWRDK